MNPTIKYYKIFLSLTFLRTCKKSVANSWERETGPTIVRLMRLCKSGGGLWWPTTVTAKPKTSRQRQKHHGKNKNLTAKTKTSRQNQKPHRQKQNTSQQNQILHSKSKIALGLPWVFAFAMRYLFFAVGICFCHEVFVFAVRFFGFAVTYFVFAMRFLVLPWQLWATVVVRRQCLQFCNYFTDCNA